MQTYHIHISGRVQGVGFRPLVCRLANALNIQGTIANGMDGVHIRINASPEQAKRMMDGILHSPPKNSIITTHEMTRCKHREFKHFRIVASDKGRSSDMLITPDLALCGDCRTALTETNNRRKGYAFTTCLSCGPRYSIMKRLPYDRENTTMSGQRICSSCAHEYEDVRNRRHHSQTNSCPDCAILMHWHVMGQGIVRMGQEEVIKAVSAFIREGRIVALKGIGGYLLICDATSEDSVMELRKRKHRPFKPFAVMYPDAKAAARDVRMDDITMDALNSPAAPIVLCPFHDDGPGTGLAKDAIAPGLNRSGIMLPYSPLLALLADATGIPLVVTSGNISGAPIIHQDHAALDLLREVADGILTNDIDIITPQDDSVWQFDQHGKRIIIRRSRGMAPTLHPHSVGTTSGTILAMGADLKSAFAIHHQDKVYGSQYLGDLEDYRSQQTYLHTIRHLLDLSGGKLQCVLTDRHPGYHSSLEGKRLALDASAELHRCYHHEAHFAAVLAENNLLECTEPVMGMVWDGTGYGSDGQSWGGECFIFDQGSVERVMHLDYFPQLLGDKMSREPRLSAWSLLADRQEVHPILEKAFSQEECVCYRKLLLQGKHGLTSSMGRLIDGVSAILGIRDVNTYEGQAAMELEALAGMTKADGCAPYIMPFRNNRIDWRPMIDMILQDIEAGADRSVIAFRFLKTLAALVIDSARHLQVSRIAISGGVFQNALLNTLIRDRLEPGMTLYTHIHLSPNDECIAFGQVALHHLKMKQRQGYGRTEKPTDHQDTLTT